MSANQANMDQWFRLSTKQSSIQTCPQTPVQTSRGLEVDVFKNEPNLIPTRSWDVCASC